MRGNSFTEGAYAMSVLSESGFSGRIHQSEVLAGLSYALDLTEGQRPGHSVRSCLIGMRIAVELGLPAEQRSALYYALLLKDAGCSSNAARMAALFGGDDRELKRRSKTSPKAVPGMSQPRTTRERPRKRTRHR